MTFEIWNKDKLAQLTEKEKEEWFDVLNDGLEEDRGYSLDDPNIDAIRQTIKQDYMKYLHDCRRTNEYFLYYVLRDETNQMVSICRVQSKAMAFYLEGLQTHRDYLYKGYAIELPNRVFKELKESNITELRSHVHINNYESNRLHEKLGFERYDTNGSQHYYKRKIMGTPRRLPSYQGIAVYHYIKGIPYHEDNNDYYYRLLVRDLKSDYVYKVLMLNLIFVFIFDFYNVLSITLNIGLYLLINIFNTIRYFKVKDRRYKEVVSNYAITTFKILLLVNVIALILYGVKYLF